MKMTIDPEQFIVLSLRKGPIGNIDAYGPRSDLENIKRVIEEAFTEEELNIMCKHGGVRVEIRKLRKGAPGVYERKQDGIPVPRICLGPDARDDQIVHEFVHHLRTADDRRTGITRTSYPVDTEGKVIDSEIVRKYLLDIKNVEESATTAETVVRMKSVCGLSKYFDKTGVPSDQAYRHDRMLLTDSDDIKTSENIRGAIAVKMVGDKFEMTMISRLRLYPLTCGRTAKESFDLLKDVGIVEDSDRNK